VPYSRTTRAIDSLGHRLIAVWLSCTVPYRALQRAAGCCRRSELTVFLSQSDTFPWCETSAFRHPHRNASHLLTRRRKAEFSGDKNAYPRKRNIIFIHMLFGEKSGSIRTECGQRLGRDTDAALDAAVVAMQVRPSTGVACNVDGSR
jgi:hypothetical protein